MYETRSRFDNRYVTKELGELDFKRYMDGRETVLPLNRRERAKYISVLRFFFYNNIVIHIVIKPLVKPVPEAK